MCPRQSECCCSLPYSAMCSYRMVAAAGWGKELQLLLVRLLAEGRGWGRARLRVARPALGRVPLLVAHQPVVGTGPHHPVLADRGCRRDLHACM
jgi:hypothetical protein